MTHDMFNHCLDNLFTYHTAAQINLTFYSSNCSHQSWFVKKSTHFFFCVCVKTWVCEIPTICVIILSSSEMTFHGKCLVAVMFTFKNPRFIPSIKLSSSKNKNLCITVCENYRNKTSNRNYKTKQRSP